MTLDEFNHYGYSRRVFRESLCDVSINNFNAAYHLNTWFLAIMVALTLFSAANVFPSAFLPIYATFAILSAATEYATMRIRKRGLEEACETDDRVIRTLAHAEMTLLLAFGIAASVVDPTVVATSFLVIMVIVGIVFMETMAMMAFRLVLAAGILIVCSFAMKEASLATGDATNAIIFLVGALILHFMFQREKIERFITARMLEQSRRQLKVQSTFDCLTGLLNRGAFFDLADAILQSDRNETIAFLIIDLDRFKFVNDNFGHKRGDATLVAAARAIREEVGMNPQSWDFMQNTFADGSNFAGRLGGDEFIVAARGLESENAAREVAQRIVDRIRLICIDRETAAFANASAGVALASGNRILDVDELYQIADLKLYEEKRRER